MKNTKQYIQIVAIMLIVAGILLYFGGDRMESIPSGFSTLSLTSGTAFISSDQFFNEPTYALAVVADGSSGSLRGTFTPSQISEYTGTQVPSNSFNIKIDMENQTCVYTIHTPKTFEIWRYSGFQYPCTTSGSSGTCPFYRGSKYGEVYQIDSVVHYDSKINVALETANETYSLMLTPTNKNGEISGVLRASLIGSFMGDQSCPVPSADTILYRPVGSSVLYAKPAYLLAQLQAIQPCYAGDIEGALYSPCGTTPTLANSVADQFLNAGAPTSSAYCPNNIWNDQETTYVCSPASSVALPLLKMYVKASVLGVVVPSGTPQIVSVSAPTVEAAQTTKIMVKVKNIGAEQDSFDLAISGRHQVNLQATRITLSAGEETDVPVYIQAAGTVGNYTITMTSVNSPLKTTTLSFKLIAEPFCDLANEPGKMKVNTEFGCKYVCQDTFSDDLREKNCAHFGDFEPLGAYNSLTQTGTSANGTPTYSTIAGIENEYHCTGIGIYTSLEDYMNYVFQNSSRVFIPTQIANTYWLGSTTCNYVAEYGYHYDEVTHSAVPIIEEDFSYTATPNAGTLTDTGSLPTCPEGYVAENGNCIYIQPSSSTGTGTTTITGTTENSETSNMPDDNMQMIIIIVASLGVIFVASILLGKKGRRLV